MFKIKKIISFVGLFIIGIGIVFSADNFFKSGKNWDANRNPNADYSNPNDNFTFSGRLDLEDSRTEAYANGYRGKLEGKIYSSLFGYFENTGALELYHKLYNPNKNLCGGEDSLELYSLSGSIISKAWGIFDLEQNESYLCSNKYVYMLLKSLRLGEKEIGTGSIQDNLNDPFGKQEIFISGIIKIKGDIGTGILNRGESQFNTIKINTENKTKYNELINKHINFLYRTFKNNIKTGITDNQLDDINKLKKENYYLYNYKGKHNNIYFPDSSTVYKNRGFILKIGSSGTNTIKVGNGIHTVVVQSGNIFINSNITIKGKEDKSLLILVAKRDKSSGDGGNIYINPDVTNIDAVLIADGSIISLSGNNIQSVKDSNQVNNLRKQLLIYGLVMSSNVVGINQIPYGADLYENNSYTNNEMDGNIYDLGNLRTFNLNYGSGDVDGDGYPDNNKLFPIDGNGGYLLNRPWIGQCNGYKKTTSSTNYQLYKKDCNPDLRESSRDNPLIIEYNKNIKFLNPYLLRTN